MPVLETIILLYQNRDGDAPKVGERLYISEAMAGAILAQLVQRGLLGERESGEQRLYCYRPNDGGLEGVVDRLVEVYVHSLIPLTRLIHSKLNTSVRDFADAFRLRDVLGHGRHHLVVLLFRLPPGSIRAPQLAEFLKHLR